MGLGKMGTIRRPKCRDCLFYYEGKPNRHSGVSMVGECRANNPVPVYNTEDKFIESVFPTVSHNLWCGQWVGLEDDDEVVDQAS